MYWKWNNVKKFTDCCAVVVVVVVVEQSNQKCIYTMKWNSRKRFVASSKIIPSKQIHTHSLELNYFRNRTQSIRKVNIFRYNIKYITYSILLLFCWLRQSTEQATRSVLNRSFAQSLINKVLFSNLFGNSEFIWMGSHIRFRLITFAQIGPKHTWSFSDTAIHRMVCKRMKATTKREERRWNIERKVN